MRNLVYFVFSMCCFSLNAQQHVDENIKALIEKYSVDPILKCQISVEINVEGMQIPNKTILVDFEEGEKPKITGKGLTLLPKKGMINQFKELFETPMQAIFMGNEDHNLSYKLVSLDNKSKWVTADVIFDENTFQIYESVINTRGQGSFKAIHTYEHYKYPSKSVITFDVKKFKIPLRFIGRNDKVSRLPENDENVLGEIILNYTYLD